MSTYRQLRSTVGRFSDPGGLRFCEKNPPPALLIRYFPLVVHASTHIIDLQFWQDQSRLWVCFFPRSARNDPRMQIFAHGNRRLSERARSIIHERGPLTSLSSVYVAPAAFVLALNRSVYPSSPRHTKTLNIVQTSPLIP